MTSRPLGWALALSFCISACGGGNDGSGGGNGGSTVGSTSTSTPTAAAQCSALSGLAIPASAIAEPTAVPRSRARHSSKPAANTAR